jgi:small subunit ribosomal protein S16
MLIIRLQRTGKKNQADFRIVLTEKAAPVQKKFLEVLGSYNPRKKYFQVKEERLKHWLGQHVALSETLNNLLVTKGLFSGPKVKAFSIPKKPVVVEAPDSAKASAVAEAMADKPSGELAVAKTEATSTTAETSAPTKVPVAPTEEAKPSDEPKPAETSAQ